MKLKHPNRFWIAALLVAILFDFLFWEKKAGISVFIFFMLLTTGSVITLSSEQRKLPWQSWLLLLPIAGFAAGTVFRAEPFTTATNILLSLTFLVIFWISATIGEWLIFRMKEFTLGFFKLLLSLLIEPIRMIINQSAKIPAAENATEAQPVEKPKFTKKIAPYVRGLLIAAPIVILLTLLLASADAVFSEKVQHFFDIFRIENLGELIFRGFYILILTYIFLAAYLHAATQSQTNQVKDDQPLVKPFLGNIEAVIVLAAINALFAAFVFIQFKYFFGGNTNINIEGFTYAEYARKGFFELLFVAILSLLIFYGLGAVTNRKKSAERWSFTILGVLLVGFVGVLLVSAFQRLGLYEIAFGFTRLRLVTHIFMIWLGILLVLTVCLELFKQLKRFPQIVLLAAVGFGVTLNLVNVDQEIVRRNIAHYDALEIEETSVETGKDQTYSTAQDVWKMDFAYLYSLSADALPELISQMKNPALDVEIQAGLRWTLKCWMVGKELPDETYAWQSYHYSAYAGLNLLVDNLYELKDYSVFQHEDYDNHVGGSNFWVVKVDGINIACPVDYSYLD